MTSKSMTLDVEDEEVEALLVDVHLRFCRHPFVVALPVVISLPRLVAMSDVEVVGADEEDVLLVLALEDEMLDFVVVFLVCCLFVIALPVAISLLGLVAVL